MSARFSPEPLRVQVGILLSGCGHFDGSDVQEAVLCALALDKRGAKAVALAPQRAQLHVVDHTLGDEMACEARDIYLESSRILHDKIHPLSGFPLETLQALVVPGGFGAAKNLMSGFAQPGVRREAHPDAASAVRHFLESGKPIGVVGLGDILIGHLTGSPLEDPQEGLDAAEVRRHGDGGVVSTPGFKSFRRVSEVAVGIEAMVETLLAEVMRR
jgi:enhancing lycopene biosynthesis protein 2